MGLLYAKFALKNEQKAKKEILKPERIGDLDDGSDKCKGTTAR